MLGPWNVEEIVTDDTCKGDFTHEVRADTTVVFVVGRETGLDFRYNKEKWEFIGKEHGGSLWMENQ